MIKEITQEIEIKATEAEQLSKTYDSYKIETAEQYVASSEDLKTVKRKIKELDVERKKITSPIDDSKKAVMDFFRKPLDFLAMAENKIAIAMQSFQQAERRKAEAEQARLAELQRKETERLQNKARIAEEKAEALQEQARILQETNSIEAERLRLQAEKIAIKAETLTEKAQQTEAITPVVEINIPKVSGITNRDNWGYIIEDMKSFLEYCLAFYPTELIIENSVAMGKLARATKGTLQIPGVRFTNDNRIGGCR